MLQLSRTPNAAPPAVPTSLAPDACPTKIHHSIIFITIRNAFSHSADSHIDLEVHHTLVDLSLWIFRHKGQRET